MVPGRAESEFIAMAQLLELRTQNYQLSDDLRKNSAELNAVRLKLSVLERDLVKAQKVIGWLVGCVLLQEVDALLSENEMLQGKLHSQEDDFRLQNSTLMAELSKLCTQIEQLETENRRLQEGGGASGPPADSACGPADGELLRLQAENAALHKKLRALQERFDGELQRPPVAHGDQSVATETDGPAGTNRVSDVAGGGAGAGPEGTNQREELVSTCSKIDEINQRREEEVKAANLRLQKLQSDLTAANQMAVELKEQLESKETQHQAALQALKDQAANRSALSQEQVDVVLLENDALRTNLAALEQIQTSKTQELNLLREQQEALAAELHQRRAEQEGLLAQRDDLSSQLQESSFANRKLLEQLTEETQEKEQLLGELEETRKTAEKRKAMLDDMASQLNQVKSDHKEALSDLRLQHEKEVLGVRARYEKELRVLHEEKNRSEEEIRQQLKEEKGRTRELQSLQQQLEDLQQQLQAMEGTRGWFERRLKEAEAVILFQELKDTVDGQRILEKKGSSAVSSSRPTAGESRAAPTNAASLQLKDLKRQLQLERRRADKLQERLQDILTNSRTRTGLEELVLSEISSPSWTQQTGDSSSVSSFSYRDVMKDSSVLPAPSGAGSPQSQRPADLSDDEVGELFQRLAEVQQEKWMLEEKVKHLEVSCSSMAEDICRKSAIIETYVMDSRSQGDRGGLGSVLRDLVKPGDENLREMNKKLQNMLEEQLTKNMHLQKVISDQLLRFSLLYSCQLFRGTSC
uniref:GRIP1 associated protein 1 n=1 Tax=Poecilia mexicana TaxID=48701 RepID=A0A3B3X653_9TELE